MHSDLIAKLEALDGPSREVDLSVAEYFGAGLERTPTKNTGKIAWPGDTKCRPCPPYTASLDATVALVGRVLPGWEYQRKVTSTGIFIQMVGPEYVRFEFMGSRNPHMGASSPVSARNFYRGDAIALLIATLKALEARDG